MLENMGDLKNKWSKNEEDFSINGEWERERERLAGKGYSEH